jgi:hypothetical protein
MPVVSIPRRIVSLKGTSLDALATVVECAADRTLDVIIDEHVLYSRAAFTTSIGRFWFLHPVAFFV